MNPSTEISLTIQSFTSFLLIILAGYGSGLAMYFKLLQKVNLISNDLEWLKKEIREMKEN